MFSYLLLYVGFLIIWNLLSMPLYFKIQDQKKKTKKNSGEAEKIHNDNLGFISVCTLLWWVLGEKGCLLYPLEATGLDLFYFTV